VRYQIFALHTLQYIAHIISNTSDAPQYVYTDNLRTEKKL